MQTIAAARGILNENRMRMFFGIYMIMIIDPQILFNDGYYDLSDVRIPEGPLLRPRFPAVLSGRTRALGRIFDVLGSVRCVDQPAATATGRHHCSSHHR